MLWMLIGGKCHPVADCCDGEGHCWGQKGSVRRSSSRLPCAWQCADINGRSALGKTHDKASGCSRKLCNGSRDQRNITPVVPSTFMSGAAHRSKYGCLSAEIGGVQMFVQEGRWYNCNRLEVRFFAYISLIRKTHIFSIHVCFCNLPRI